jgi:hypothetical protein
MDAFKSHGLTLQPRQPHGAYLVIQMATAPDDVYRYAQIPRQRMLYDGTDDEIAAEIARRHGPGRVWIVDHDRRHGPGRVIYFHENARQVVPAT